MSRRPKFLHIGGWADGEWLEVDPTQKYQRQVHPRLPKEWSIYRRSEWHAGGATYVVFAHESLDAEDIFELLVLKYTNAHRC